MGAKCFYPFSYADHVTGKISEVRFAKMLAHYETEQAALVKTADELKEKLITPSVNKVIVI